MNGIDKLFRARVEEWLSKKKHTEADLANGAMMVLQCNRNRAMYNTMMRKPSHYEEKMVYELKKHLAYLQDDMNLEDVKKLEKKILPVIGKAIADTEETTDKAAAALGEIPEDSFLPAPALSSEEPYKQTDAIVARGKRTDHDTLPETIRAIWDKNAERYKKIKQAHETCKTLTAACDRYEFTSAIAELWAEYKKDFDTYDHYVLVAKPALRHLQLISCSCLQRISRPSMPHALISPRTFPSCLPWLLQPSRMDSAMHRLRSWRVCATAYSSASTC